MEQFSSNKYVSRRAYFCFFYLCTTEILPQTTGHFLISWNNYFLLYPEVPKAVTTARRNKEVMLSAVVLKIHPGQDHSMQVNAEIATTSFTLAVKGLFLLFAVLCRIQNAKQHS